MKEFYKLEKFCHDNILEYEVQEEGQKKVLIIKEISTKRPLGYFSETKDGLAWFVKDCKCMSFLNAESAISFLKSYVCTPDLFQTAANQIEEDKKDIDHPARYNGGSEYECYKVLQNWLTEEQYKGFLLGNSLKYLCRLGKKDNNVQELNKARWYLDKLIEEESKIEVAFEEKK